MAAAANLPPSNDKNIELSFRWKGDTTNEKLAIADIQFIFEGFKTKIQADVLKLNEERCPFICTRTKEGSTELVKTNPNKLKVSLKQIENLKIVIGFFDFKKNQIDKSFFSEKYPITYRDLKPNENYCLLITSAELQIHAFLLKESSESLIFKAVERNRALRSEHRQFSNFLISIFSVPITQTIEANLGIKIENCEEIIIGAIQSEVEKIDPERLKAPLSKMEQGLENVGKFSQSENQIFQKQKMRIALEALQTTGLSNIMRMTLQFFARNNPITNDFIEQLSEQFAIQSAHFFMEK